MVKSLFDNEKNIKPGEGSDIKNPMQPAQGGALPAKDTKTPASASPPVADDWKKIAWRDSSQGRAAIRLFSRGILGAAFFAWGGKYARNAPGQGMEGYSHSFETGVENAWDLNANITKPLKLIARVIDKGIASPIKKTLHVVTGNEKFAEDFVRFRPMQVKFRNTAKQELIHGGRSLGEEVIGITFDFFCASVGDALGRDIADALDKNVKKDWLDDKGHINLEKAGKSAAKTLWRYLSYNGGEDWAVAIPYAYYMKGQRHILNNITRGAEIDINENNNGAAFKIDVSSGKTKVIGNYNATGAYDLQSRFTVYNMGTLLYREAYNWAANRLQGHPTNLYGAPDTKHGPVSVGETVEGIAKWITRGIVKGFIYMTPATPFFWVTRTPQTAYKGTFIDPSNETALAYKTNELLPGGQPKFKLVKGQLLWRHKELGGDFTRDTPVYVRKFTGNIDPVHSPLGWETVGKPSVELNPFHNRDFNYNNAPGVVSTALRPFGTINDNIRRSVRRAGIPFGIAPEHMSRFVNASISYTPYMYMKAETAKMWDTGKMDMAAERMIDGAFKFDAGEFKAGAKEVWRTILRQPLEDPLREAEGNRRKKIDPSAPDDALMSSAQENEIKDNEFSEQRASKKHAARDANKAKELLVPREPVTFTTNTSTTLGAAQPAAHLDGLSWEERTIVGRKPSQTRDPLEAMAKPQQLSHADRQKMRDFLIQAVPPTKSLN